MKNTELEPVETVGFVHKIKKWFKNNKDCTIILWMLCALLVIFAIGMFI